MAVIEGIKVIVYEEQNGTYVKVGETLTDVSGNYSLTGLRKGGTFKVQFQDPGLPPGRDSDSFQDVYASGDSAYRLQDAQPYTWSANETGFDFIMYAPSTLSGTITGDGLPMVNVKVTAFMQLNDGNFLQKASAITDISGNYLVKPLLNGLGAEGALTTGKYKIRFEDLGDPSRSKLYGTIYSGNSTDFAAASTVQLGVGNTVYNISMVQTSWVELSGTVTD